MLRVRFSNSIPELPKPKQRFVMKMLDTVLAQTSRLRRKPVSANADVLYEKLKALPPQRRAEVEDFVDFLARKETRTAALDRLLAIAPALEAAGEPQITEEEIAAEIRAYRAEKRAPASQDPKAKGRA